MSQDINRKLSADLAQAGAKVTPMSFDAVMAEWFKNNFKRLTNLAGSQESARKIFLMALNVCSKNPMLLDCEINSLFRCILTSCELNLYPGPMQECAYVPYRNKGKLEAQFMPMYQGLVKLAFNSGFVRNIQASVVYEKDEFDFVLGTAKHLTHKPFLGSYEDRGARVCVYGIIETLYGQHMVVKSIDFIEGIKKRSRGAQSEFSPWNGSPDDYDAMACKTLFKQGAKFIPKSTELQSAIDYDNEMDRPVDQPAKSQIIDISESVKAALPEASAESRMEFNTQPSTAEKEPVMVSTPRTTTTAK